MAKITGSMVTKNSITVAIDNKPYTVTSDNPHWETMKNCVRNNEADKFIELYNIPKGLREQVSKISGLAGGTVQLLHGEVIYNGRAWHSALTDHILWMAEEKMPTKPLLLLFERLMKNVSQRVVNEFWGWVRHYGLAITEDGFLLAMKSVRRDYKDWYSGKIDNTPGKPIPPMHRNECDDDWGTACSQGYHIGGWSYISSYHPDGRILMVKVDPADIVTVPPSETAKMRCSYYEVVRELTDEEKSEELGKAHSLYTNDGFAYETDEDEDEDFDEGGDFEDKNIDGEVNYHNKRDEHGRFTSRN